MIDSIFNFLRRRMIPQPVFRALQPIYHWLLAFSAAVFYGFPARGLTVIGVTGTNGKSTTVEMIHAIFREAGINTASQSSVRFKIGDRDEENRFKMTMPGRFFIQKFLRQTARRGATHAILEVTSEGIRQYRHLFIRFSAAVFTNLAPEHIESHGGFENYKKAKGKLFASLRGRGISIVNLDDPYANYFLGFPAGKKIGYALAAGDPQPATGELEIIAPAAYEIAKHAIHLYFNEGWAVSSPLAGKFNAENMMAAIAVAAGFGVSRETIRAAFEKFSGVPGRMEVIQESPFRVVIDYAFTPNALKKVYQTLRNDSEGLVCVLGSAGGGRDAWKRPELGKIAGEFCRKIIVTDEDPYDEDPRAIMEAVAAGAGRRDGTCSIIEDRRAAIREALRAARAGETVIITGKGGDNLMALARGKKISWDDRAVTREELKNLRI